MPLNEITKGAAISLIELGAGYWSPECHVPTPGSTLTTVVYIAGKFYCFPKKEFKVEVKKVLHFDRASMIVSHEIICNNDEMGAIMQAELSRIAEQTRKERWAKEFLLVVQTPAVVTPRQGRKWFNKFIVEPEDRGSPPDAN